MQSTSFDNIDTTNDKITGYDYFSGKFNQELSQEDQKAVYKDIKDNNTISVPVVDENGVPQVDKNLEIIDKEVSLFPIALDYEYNTALSGVEHEVSGSSGAFTTLSVVLTILTIFLVIILINSVFKSQKREMGILKAEGVSIDKLTFGFATFVTILVVINSFIGFVLSLPGAKGFLNIYATYYSIYYYPIQTDVYFNVIKTLFIISILIIGLTTIISIRKNLNEKTLNLIKNIDSEKLPKKNIFTKAKNMSFTLKVQIIILFRNFSKSVLLFFGVSVSAFLLLLGTLMYTSVHNMIDSTYSQTFTYEYDAKLSSGKSMVENANTYISNSLQIVSLSNDAQVKEDATVAVNAYSYDTNEYFNLTNQKGKALNDKTGVTATEGFMKKYNLSIGDKVTVVNPYDVNKNVELKIVATTNDFFIPTLYIDLDMFQQLFGLDGNYTNAVSGVGDYQYIYDIDPNASVYKADDLQIQMGDSLRIFMMAILIVMILASVIAYISLTAITSVIIDSNKKTISVMKVLGYTTKEISNMTVGIYKWFVIVIYIVMMPVLQFIIQQIVNQAMKDMDFTMTVHINYLIGSVGLLIIWLVYMLSYKTSMRKINKISLAESVKADE